MVIMGLCSSITLLIIKHTLQKRYIMEREPIHNSSNDLFLSRIECNMMRGLAIILIVLNNFGHKINGVHRDNEFNYSYDSVLGFIDSITNNSGLMPLELLSFFSPYGVMLFIFLSGYGLVLKYEKGTGMSVSNTFFVIDHYKKLFVMQAKGLTFFFLVYLIFESKEIIAIVPFLKQLLLTGNILSHHFIIPGPYWFFCMIFEMYLIYRFVLCRCSSSIVAFLALVSLVIMAFLEPNGKIITYVRMNIGLALLPFCLGVLIARHWRNSWNFMDSKWKCFISFFFSFVLLTLCKFNFYSWLIMPIFIVVNSISLVKLLIDNKTISQVLAWLGGLSGVIFVVHPALREILISRTNESGQCYEVIILYFFLTIVLSYMLRPVFSK